jgi:branched-chain amino acid transport system ATP-binding protein
MLLELEGVHLSYGRIEALHGIDLTVGEGEIVALIGANGAGKTSTMRAISGLRSVSPGRITFAGEDITKLRADQRVRRGLCLAPEGRGIFPGMTVLENLDMGAYTRTDRAATTEDLDRVYNLFPRLAERRRQAAGTLSGGEQQMLAIGRALMARPKLLMLDEPSMGLAPMLIQQIFTSRALPSWWWSRTRSRRCPGRTVRMSWRPVES